MFGYVTAGESHGRALTVIVSGVPAGIPLCADDFARDMARRRAGFGRSARQRLERDEVMVAGGVRFGYTTGAPVCLTVPNAAAARGGSACGGEGGAGDAGAGECEAGGAGAGYAPTMVPRPGHADLCGVQKYGLRDCADVSERASARETAARVAAGCVARALLAALGVDVYSFVSSVGKVALNCTFEKLEQAACAAGIDREALEADVLRCPDAPISAAMCAEIEAAAAAGTSVGGTFCVVATGLVPGLGGYVSGSERLTAALGAAVLGIPAVRGVEFGLGFEAATRSGQDALDDIVPCAAAPTGLARATNRAGGIEGGMSTGAPLILRAAMKPIPTQVRALPSVDLATLQPAPAPVSRADVCAVPAAAVVAEAEVAFVLARAYLKKFGGDTLDDIKAALKHYSARLQRG